MSSPAHQHNLSAPMVRMLARIRDTGDAYQNGDWTGISTSTALVKRGLATFNADASGTGVWALTDTGRAAIGS